MQPLGSLFLPAALLLLLVSAGDTRAATANGGCVVPNPHLTVNDCWLTYRAAKGESNRFTIHFAGRGRLVDIVDAGARIRAEGACVRVSRHHVRCPRPVSQSSDASPAADVFLGDRNDRARVTRRRGVAAPAVLHLGSGADHLTACSGARVLGDSGDDRLRGGCTLEGGPGRDHLVGGPGGDFLDGGIGRDLVEGGAGDDELVGTDDDDANHPPGPAPARDRLRGGPGVDTLRLERRGAPTRIDLAAHVAGSERDRLSSIENVVATGSPLEIRGDDGPNRLEAVSGPAVLAGGRGNDTLISPFGSNDHLDGGPGDDDLAPVGDIPFGDSGDADTLACGSGEDAVITPFQQDRRHAALLPADCERAQHEIPGGYVEPGGIASFGRPAFRGGSLRIDVRFHPTAAKPTGIGTGTVTMTTADGAVLGTARWTSVRPRDQTLIFTLTDAGRSAVRPGTEVYLSQRAHSFVWGSMDWRVGL